MKKHSRRDCAANVSSYDMGKNRNPIFWGKKGSFTSPILGLHWVQAQNRGGE